MIDGGKSAIGFDGVAKKKASRKPAGSGRKAGSRNRDYDEVTTEKPQCQKCGSTERSHYHKTITRKLPINSQNRPQFTHEVSRSCRCLKCGKWRLEKTLENSEGWECGRPILEPVE